MRYFKPKKTYYFHEEDTKGAVIDLWGSPNSSNIITDKSGNGNDCAIDKSILFTNGGEDITISSFPERLGSMTIADDASFKNPEDLSIIIDGLYYRSTGESGGGRFFQWGGSLLAQTAYIVAYSDGQANWNPGLPIGTKAHFAFRHDRSDGTSNLSGFINGAPVTLSNVSAKSGNFISYSDPLILMNNSISGNRQADVDFSRFRLYKTLLPDADIREEYVKYALGYFRRFTARTEYGVTSAPVSAPAQVGPWYTWAGSHEWLDDGTGRYLYTGSTNGFASLQSKQAYGAWYFKSETDALLNIAITFIANEPDQEFSTSSTLSGYILYYRDNGNFYIYKRDSGSTTIVAVVADTYAYDNEFFITRRVYDGLFKVYVRNSNYSTWTLLIEDTDNSITESNYMSFYNRSGIGNVSLYDVIAFPFGDSLHPNDIEEIAD